MNPGSQNDVVSAIIARFNDGKGATIRKAYAVGRSRDMTLLTIYLCPSRLCDEATNGLLIVVEGRGSYVWDGLQRLNYFKLVTAGIKPIPLAQELANLCNHLVATLAVVRLDPTEILALPHYEPHSEGTHQ